MMNKKTRILYIDTTRRFGGAISSLAYLLWNLDQARYEPYVVSGERSDFWDNPKRDIPVMVIKPRWITESKLAKVITSGIGRSFLSCLNLIFCVIPYTTHLYLKTRKLGINIIHLNNHIYKNMGGILLAKMYKVPCIAHHRCFENHTFIVRFLVNFIDRHIAISEAIKRDLIALGVPEEKITIVPEGIDLLEYNLNRDISGLRKEFGVRENTPTFGIVGCLTAWKGHPVFLKAAKIVLEDVPDGRGFIVGGTDNAYQEELEALAEDLGIADKVYFTGHRRNVADFMSLLDVVVHASTSPEPFGRVIIEAMAMEKLVVASKIGAPLEIIEHGKNGFLTTPGNHAELAAILTKLLKENKNYESVKKAARKTVENRFTIQRHVQKIESVYNDFLKVRIGQVVYGLTTAGLEKVVVNLCSNIDRSRFEPVVFCISSHDDLVPELEKRDIKVVFLNRRDNVVMPFLLFRLAKLLKKERINIVHTHNFAGYLYGVIAAILANIPVVIHTQHGQMMPHEKKGNFIRRVLSWKVTKFVAVAEALRKQLIEYSGINPDKIVTIPNGIEPIMPNGAPRSEIRRNFGFTETDKLVGIVARLDPVKDHRTLLNSFPKVMEKVNTAKLVIIGDGPERPHLVDLARRLGIEKSVHFLGVRHDVQDILTTLDLFVLTSKWESMPVTLIEAMRASLPIVATNVGGNPEIIEDGINGVLVPHGSPDRLSEGIVAALNDEMRARAMGVQGRRLFENKYTLPKMVETYQKIYSNFI